MNPKILIVDDEPDIVRLLQMKLQRSGYEVVTAYCGSDAVLKAEEERPDAVLLDAMMPGMDGFTAMIRIKQNIKPAPIVLMLTALDTYDDMKYALTNGADDYVTKPFSPRDLMSRLNVALIKAGKTPPLNDMLTTLSQQTSLQVETFREVYES